MPIKLVEVNKLKQMLKDHAMCDCSSPFIYLRVALDIVENCGEYKEPHISYICKYQGSDKCESQGDCTHTQDIRQALNFVDLGDNYYEEIESRRVGEWVEKGSYGNGSAFAPMQATYECPNCKLLAFSKTLYCPECGIKMTNGVGYYDECKKEGDEK